MMRIVSSILLLAVLLLGTVPATQADEQAIARCHELAKTLGLWADTVLAHHVEPPVRQQMLLAAVRSAYAEAALYLSAEATQKFSDGADDQLLAHLAKLLHQLEQETDLTAMEIEAATIRGLLHSFPGETRLVTKEELGVEIGSNRFQSNTYVGIGIALGQDEEDEELGYSVREVFPGASGDVAGLKANDVIEAVDGKDVRGMELTKVIQLLRGPEYSTLELVVRRSDEPEPRTISIARRIVPREFVGNYEVIADKIAYAKVEQVAASTVHELRQMEKQARRDGCQALLLDLRGCGQSDVHYAVTLADALLDDQPIGRWWTPSKVTEYTASPESLFSDWPLAVLWDLQTSDHAAWVVDALRAADRARVIVGIRRSYFVYEPVASPSGDHFIIMATGRLLTPDASALGSLSDTTALSRASAAQPVDNHDDQVAGAFDRAVRWPRKRVASK